MPASALSAFSAPLSAFGPARKRAAAAFDPQSPASLSLWLNYTQKVYSDAGTTPAVLNDPIQQQTNYKTGATNFVSQATLAARPILKSDGIQGGSNIHIVNNSGAVALSTADFTLYAVGVYSSGAWVAIGGGSGGGADFGGLFLNAGTLNALGDSGAGPSGAWAPAAGPVIVRVRRESGTTTVRATGGFSASAGTLGAWTLKSFYGRETFGVWDSGGGNRHQHIYVCTAALGATTMAALETYFGFTPFA